MTCARCGATNREGRKFCAECAAPLALACPSCGASNQPGERFCGECAALLGGAGQSAGPGGSGGGMAPTGGPAAERRLVTVLFADLVGFTPFAEERDAEEVRELLSQYFDLASDIIRRHAGTVEKFIGDAVMALWGAPTAREDDAERAVRAALELVDAVRSLGPTIRARAGVLTGEAAVTVGATNQGLVAGDLVNTAARLQSAAPPGVVLVGEATQRAAAGAIVFEAAGDQLLKGKASPVPAWRAMRVVAERGGRGRSDLPEPPFVGRDEELRLLKDLIGTTGRDPRPRLVSITGPAGIGKSRLAWELEKYVDGLVEPIFWHRGRSPSYGEGITFWALGEMVRRRAGLAEADDEATTRARIRATVADHVPADEDRRWVEPALLALLGLEEPPTGGRDVLFAAWRIFFERIAAQGTTVLVFEDLHWADSGLLDFVEHLLAWAKAAPILVVTLARPELADRRPGWGSSVRHLTTLALEPLSDAAMRTLLDGFVPGLPERAAAAILARAEGVPLYAVETVRALVAEGRLALVEGAYRPAGDLTALAIPDTLRSLIASRLDALEPGDRSLVQVASVMGQTFSRDGLAAVAGLDSAEVDARLANLVRRELLALEADPRSPERGQYTFVQSLIREVAYGTLARRDRRERHLAVARQYEALGDEELAGALAVHYVEAFRASTPGPEADAVAAQARIALRGAAERAAALGAHAQAVSFATQALEVTADPAERAALLLRAAVSADADAGYAEALAFVERAVAACTEADDRAGALRAEAQRATILLDAGRTREAADLLAAVLATFDERIDEAATHAELLATYSRALMRETEPERSVEMADRALAIAERLDLELVVADAFNNKGSSLGYLGRRREAVALLAAAVDLAHGGGFVGAELRARGNLSSILSGDDPRGAEEMARAALALARRLGNRMMANWLVSSTIGAAYTAGGDWDRAIADGEEVLASTDDPGDIGRALSWLTLVRQARGEPVGADVDRLGELAREVSDPGTAAVHTLICSTTALLRGDYPAASDLGVRAAGEFPPLAQVSLEFGCRGALWGRDPERARRVAELMEAIPDSDRGAQIERTTARAAVAALEGRRDEAIHAYRDAIRRWLADGQEFVAALVALDFAVTLGSAEPAVREVVEGARAVFARVGAVPYVARLDAAMATPGAGSVGDSSRPAGRTTAEDSRAREEAGLP
jgi:class 3 adenylate cyclase/tetratricopeptide (TPR) repeat protein